MDIIGPIVGAILFLVILFAPIVLLADALEKPYRTPCTEKGGRMHQWSMPAFRLRVCDHCGRREFFMRAWEFDGYERKQS